MDTLTVSFFGHRRLDNVFGIEQTLETIIRKLLNRPEYIEFLVGRDGEFDQLASSTVKRCRREIREDNSALIWVLPYATAELRDNEEAFLRYYDEIEICERSAGSHYKAAIQIRNRAMIDRSDFAVFCVERRQGGAYQTLRYAEKHGVRHINLLNIK